MKEQKIIVKKIIKRAAEGSHGGTWKVAYADFVTAMMAFFLLLWLITMVAPEKRARVAAYFKYFKVFEQSGQSLMSQSSQMFEEMGEAEKRIQQELNESMRPEQFKEIVRMATEDKLGDVKDQVIVDTFEGGVRIQLVDRDGHPMFNAGSAKPTPLAMRALQIIADNIKLLPNPVALEGHTDSTGYRSSSYNNWDLSTERALTARNELERFGVQYDRFSRVAGYSDTLPLIREDPSDPRNRRISIILFFPKRQIPQA